MAKANRRIVAHKKGSKAGKPTTKPARKNKARHTPDKRSKSMVQSASRSTVRQITEARKLFYTNVPHMELLVFAPPKVAEYNSAIYRALEATTWGEFKAMIPPKEYKQLLKRLRDGEYDLDDDEGDDTHKQRNLPENNDPFDPDFWFPGFSEGDYPDWLQTKQDLWLPDSILERFARHDTSVLNGDFWIIDPVFEKDIVEELRREGFSVTRRDDLSFH